MGFGGWEYAIGRVEALQIGAKAPGQAPVHMGWLAMVTHARLIVAKHAKPCLSTKQSLALLQCWCMRAGRYFNARPTLI